MTFLATVDAGWRSRSKKLDGQTGGREQPRRIGQRSGHSLARIGTRDAVQLAQYRQVGVPCRGNKIHVRQVGDRDKADMRVLAVEGTPGQRLVDILKPMGAEAHGALYWDCAGTSLAPQPEARRFDFLAKKGFFDPMQPGASACSRIGQLTIIPTTPCGRVPSVSHGRPSELAPHPIWRSRNATHCRTESCSRS
jgi:hypothetical protein